MYQRILVPIDGSETSDQGLDEAIALARLTGGSIRLLNVLDELVFTTGFETGATYTEPSCRRCGRAASGSWQRAPDASPRPGGGRHADGRVLRETTRATSSSSTPRNGRPISSSSARTAGAA
jgi:hypothetical protein